eukprot:m.334390 g.334390  ORF g.334390 m.334390 type:complete len:365 (+) comp20505_c1_seq1:642-1736(+)
MVPPLSRMPMAITASGFSVSIIFSHANGSSNDPETLARKILALATPPSTRASIHLASMLSISSLCQHVLTIPILNALAVSFDGKGTWRPFPCKFLDSICLVTSTISESSFSVAFRFLDPPVSSAVFADTAADVAMDEASVVSPNTAFSSAARRSPTLASTYFARTSTSIFTFLPAILCGRVIHFCVCAMSMTENRCRSWSTVVTVRLVPSTATYPFLTMYRKSSLGTAMVTHRASPSGRCATTVPMPSICPCTQCPLFLASAACARSRFTLSPGLSSPRFVNLIVSGAQCTVKLESSNFVTVRHVPLTAMLHPMYAPCTAVEHPISITRPSPVDPSQSSSAALRVTDFTFPISSIIPVKGIFFE